MPADEPVKRVLGAEVSPAQVPRDERGVITPTPPNTEQVPALPMAGMALEQILAVTVGAIQVYAALALNSKRM